MDTKTIKYLLIAALLASLVQAGNTNEPDTVSPAKDSLDSGNLKHDENVLIFPTNARYDSDKKQWIIPVHGWVFEPETDSVWRNAMISAFAESIGIEDDTAESRLFSQRTRMFLVDNERSKNIVIKIGDQIFRSPKTEANGHFEFNAYIEPKTNCENWINLQVLTNANDHRKPSGMAQCVKPSGISVISDIDDTIKDSNVLDKKALLKNTFLKEFKPVPGMSRLYNTWHKQGYNFHYVSSSPWQLYPALNQFLSDEAFPAGSMQLKLVRLKDKSLYSLFESPEDGKIPTIMQLLAAYPERKFILVGDSGEKDPEIYAEINRRFPERILRIYIHDIRNDAQRLNRTFRDIKKTKWIAFTNANDLLENLQITSAE